MNAKQASKPKRTAARTAGGRFGAAPWLDLCEQIGILTSATSELQALYRVKCSLRRCLRHLHKWFLIELHITNGALKITRLEPRQRLREALAAFQTTGSDADILPGALRGRQNFSFGVNKMHKRVKRSNEKLTRGGE